MWRKHILKLQINVVSAEDGKIPWGYWLITVDLINEAVACWSQSACCASVRWAQGDEEDAGSEGWPGGGRSVGPATGRHCSMLKSPANTRVCPQLEVGSFGAPVENTWKCPWLGVGQEAGRPGGQGGPRCLPGSAGIMRCLVSLGWEVGWVLVSESPCLLPEVLPAVGLTLAGGVLRQHLALGRKCPQMPSAVAFRGQGCGCGFEGKIQDLGPSYWQLEVGAALLLAAGPP